MKDASRAAASHNPHRYGPRLAVVRGGLIAAIDEYANPAARTNLGLCIRSADLESWDASTIVISASHVAVWLAGHYVETDMNVCPDVGWPCAGLSAGWTSPGT